MRHAVLLVCAFAAWSPAATPLFIGAYVNQATLKFLMTPKDYPPSQAPASFNLAAVRKKIEAMGGAK